MTLKDKIIDAAFEIFAEKGYEKATIAEIIEKAGSSKGGFYHHFKSKSDILQEITNMYMKGMDDQYNLMLKQTNKSTIDLLNNVFDTINTYKKNQIQDWPKLKKLYMHQDSHAIIRKMADDFEVLTAGIYLRLIQKGIDEGFFDIVYPEPLAGLWSREMIRIYGIAPTLIYSDDQKALKDFVQLVEFIERTINQALGFTEHQIAIKEPALEYIKYAKEQVELLAKMNQNESM